jgi:hypothetical protein
MKKKIEKMMAIDIEVCNICEREVDKEPYEATMKRLEIIRFLLNTENFHAHQVCVNAVIKNAFEKYIK